MNAPKLSSSCQTDESSFAEPQKSEAEFLSEATALENEKLKTKCETLESSIDSKFQEIKRLKSELELSRKHCAHMEEELIKITSVPKPVAAAVLSPQRSNSKEPNIDLSSFTAVLRDLETLKNAAAEESAAVSIQVISFLTDCLIFTTYVRLSFNIDCVM